MSACWQFFKESVCRPLTGMYGSPLRSFLSLLPPASFPSSSSCFFLHRGKDPQEQSCGRTRVSQSCRAGRALATSFKDFSCDAAQRALYPLLAVHRRRKTRSKRNCGKNREDDGTREGRRREKRRPRVWTKKQARRNEECRIKVLVLESAHPRYHDGIKVRASLFCLCGEVESQCLIKLLRYLFARFL